MDAPIPVDAGSFDAWLTQFRASLRGTGGTDVPCGDCVGCCVSSYSILVRPEEAAARRAIGAQWLTPAPALGDSVSAMGYLPDGTCPMLRERHCTIYADRPQTCRDYDCRVFAAAGIDAGKPAIDARVQAWRFTYASESEREAHRAIRAAAAFIREHGECLPELRLPKNPSGIAVLAAKSYELFLDDGVSALDAAALAAAVIAEARKFDEGEAVGG